VYMRVKSELEGFGAVEERLSRAAEVTNQPYSRVRAVQRLLQRRQLRKAACTRSPQTDVFALYRSYVSCKEKGEEGEGMEIAGGRREEG